MADKEGKRTRGLSPEQWVEVRQKFEAGKPIAELSRDYKVARWTIRARKNKESWTYHPFSQVDSQKEGTSLADAAQKRAQAEVIDLGARRMVQQLEESGALDERARLMALEFVTVGEIRSAMTRAMKKYALSLEAGTITPADMPGTRDHAQVMSDSMRTWHSFMQSFREDLGRLKGTPTAPSDDSAQAVTKIEVEIVDGRKNGTTGEATT